MNNKNSKIRTLRLSTVISGSEKGSLLKRIQLEEGVLHCMIEGSHLTLQYDLDKTSLEALLLVIKPLLETSGIKLKDGFINKLKTEFICFIETNQRDNIDNLSGWHLRLQNLYLAQANMSRHIQENRDIKTTLRNKIPDEDRNIIDLNTDRYTDRYTDLHNDG